MWRDKMELMMPWRMNTQYWREEYTETCKVKRIVQLELQSMCCSDRDVLLKRDFKVSRSNSIQNRKKIDKPFYILGTMRFVEIVAATSTYVLQGMVYAHTHSHMIKLIVADVNFSRSEITPILIDSRIRLQCYSGNSPCLSIVEWYLVSINRSLCTVTRQSRGQTIAVKLFLERVRVRSLANV